MTKRQIIAHIRALKPRDKEYLYSVPDQRGLYVCVRPDGTKPFACRYTSPITKKRRLMMLDVDDLSATKAAGAELLFDEAVVAATQLRMDVKSGVDPLAIAQREQAQSITNHLTDLEQDKLTVQLMCEWYVGYLYGGYTLEEREAMTDAQREKMLAKAKRSAAVVERSLIKDVYPEIGHVRASLATVGDCARVRNKISRRGAVSQSNRVMAYLSAAFSLAIGREGKAGDYFARMPDFGLTMNPAKGVERVNEDQNRRANERTLTPSEVARLWTEVGGDCMSYQLSVALRLLLTTGQRVEEILQAEKSEFTINEDGTGEWVIPFGRRKADAKAKHSEPHIVPLLKIHTDLVKKAKQLAGRGKYLFPAQDGNPRTSNSLNQAVRRFCKPQGVSKRKPFELFTPRDCRRTFKTLASMAGADGVSLDKLQGHNNSDLVQQHYDRYKFDVEKCQAMRVFTQALDVLVNVKATDDAEELRQLMLERFPPANVVSIRRQA